MKLNFFDLEEYLENLKDIVNIDSGSFDKEGVEEVAKYLENLYLDLGFYTKLHYLSDKAGPALEVRNNPSIDDIDVLLIGHMDTVFPEGTVSQRPYNREGDLAYGPGIIDMKAGLVSIYYAMKELKEEFDGKVNICIFHNPDEEISSRYSRDMIEELAKKSKYALVLEPARSNGALVYKRKGLSKYEIKFKGKAAHSGVDPENGISAINELAYYVKELHAMINHEAGTCVNVGIVKGGTQANVVSESAELELDLRFTDMNELQKIKDKLEFLLENPKTKGIKVEVIETGHRPPMNPSEKTQKMYEEINNIAEKLNIEIKWAATGGGSDANFTAALGVPSLDGLGPVGGGGHGPNEYLEVDTVEDRLKILVELLRTIPKL